MGLIPCNQIEKTKHFIYPRCSMYGIFTYIWLIFGVNVGKYSIHGAYGYQQPKDAATAQL